MVPRRFFQWAGWALVLGGALTLLVSVVLTPLVAGSELPFEQTAATAAFLWRQSLSALAAALLLFGSVGLYLLQANRAGRFGAVAFAMAFVGSALLLAWEWVDIFILHDLALRAPQTLRMLEEQEGLHFYDLGALVPIGLFALGWMAIAVSTIRVCRPHRRAAWVACDRLLCGSHAERGVRSHLGWHAGQRSPVLGLDPARPGDPVVKPPWTPLATKQAA